MTSAHRVGPSKTLYLQVIAGMVAGVLVGHFFPNLGSSMKPLGDGFIRLIKLLAAPIVFGTVLTGITRMHKSESVGKTLLKALVLFYVLSTLALLVGLGTVEILRPGVGMNVDPTLLDPSIALKTAGGRPAPGGVVAFILQMIPSTYFEALSDGEVLPVLLIAIMSGFALVRIGDAGLPVIRFVESFTTMLFAIIASIMRLAPIGAFGAMAFTVGAYGTKSLGSLGLLMASLYIACALFIVVVLGVLSWAHGFSLWRLLRYLRDELFIVLGTAAVEPVLPRLLVKLEALGCERGVVGLSVPAGYAFNLDGTCIYLTLATFFIAQATNTHLSLSQTLSLIGVMLMTSKGMGGVTGGGFVALVATLTVMPQVPIAGVALLVGIDRFMSEARALTSFVGNAVASVVIARWEGACDMAVLRAVLEGRPPVGTVLSEAVTDWISA
jgi:aerobic C4-dicarboxylate transport protein